MWRCLRRWGKRRREWKIVDPLDALFNGHMGPFYTLYFSLRLISDKIGISPRNVKIFYEREKRGGQRIPPPGRVICRAFHILVCIWFPIKLEFHPVRVKIFTRRRGGERETRNNGSQRTWRARACVLHSFYFSLHLVCVSFAVRRVHEGILIVLWYIAVSSGCVALAAANRGVL